MPNERLERLEERLAWLERHVTAQDRAMLEFSTRLDGIQKELTRLRAGADDGENGPPDDVRPPHY